jgi:hypothetical protein
VPEIRESIAGFFVRMFSDHEEITAPEPMKKAIEEEYGFFTIPDGFAITTRYKCKDSITIEYINQDDVFIQFKQIAHADYDFVADNRGDNTECDVNERKVLISISEQCCRAVWFEDGYVFKLYYSSPADIQTIKSLVSLVKRSK